MYDDSPDWRLMFSVYQCLYQQHPVRETSPEVWRASQKSRRKCCMPVQMRFIVLKTSVAVAGKEAMRRCWMRWSRLLSREDGCGGTHSGV